MTTTLSPPTTSDTATRMMQSDIQSINDAPVEIDGVGVGEAHSTARLGGQVEGGEKRAEMLATRSKDPGVIVDVPSEPTAEEVLAAKTMDGAVTPGVERG